MRLWKRHHALWRATSSATILLLVYHAWAASVNAPASFNKWKLTGAIGICYGLDKSMELYGLGVPLCDDLYTTYDLRLVTVEIFFF